MISETTVVKNGGTFYLRIPPHLVKFIQLKEKSKINIQDETGKKGQYLSMWIKED